VTDSINIPLPWAGPRYSDGACSHHVLLIDGVKGPHVFLTDGANGPHVATPDGAFRMFPNVQKHIPVTSKEGGSAHEVKPSLSGRTDIRKNDSLAEPKSNPTSS